MKKILLIIVLALCMFQMVVLAVVIDIGTAATDRENSMGGGYTLIVYGNPANESGTITSIEIWAYITMANCEVATFYVVSGANFSTRDTEAIGTVTAGSKQTFPVNLDVEAGDYIGVFVYTDDFIEADASGGSGVYTASGDNIPCADTTFTFYSGYDLSLYGTGATVPAVNVIFFSTPF